MKMGTKLFLGFLVALALLVGFVLLVAKERQACPNHSESHLPSLISDAQVSPSPSKRQGVHCYPSGDPPVSPKKLDEPGELFYAITFTQNFTIANGSDRWRKFAMTCQILQGPSKDSEKKGKAELIVKPRGFAGYAQVEILWPRAFKSVELKEFYYVCGCTHKVVEHPFKTFKMPFVPYE